MSERRKSARRAMWLGASDTLATAPSIPIEGDDGLLSLQVFIDNGTENGDPTDTPVGTWQLWAASGEGTHFSRLTSTTLDAELAKLNPNGNAVVSAVAIFINVPCAVVKLLYVATSGGAATRARVYATVG